MDTIFVIHMQLVTTPLDVSYSTNSSQKDSLVQEEGSLVYACIYTVHL